MALACTKAEYLTNGACFTQPNFSRHQQNCIIVYRMAQLVDSQLGSLNYSVSPFTTLNSFATTSIAGLTVDQKMAAEIGIWNSTVTEFVTPTAWGITTVPLTSSTAATAIACLDTYTPRQIENMRLFLLCKFFAGLGL